MTSPKTRMLNAYRGIFSDYYPVSPEFWYYYPAKVLGVSMIEFQREIPHWQAMRQTFAKYNADGWCIARAHTQNPHIESMSEFRQIAPDRYRETTRLRFDGVPMETSAVFSAADPCWTEKHAVGTAAEVDAYVRAELAGDVAFDFAPAVQAHTAVGEDILVEYFIGVPFFDFFAGAMGFEKAILFFLSGNDALLEQYAQMYLEYNLRLVRKVAESTAFEALFIGCNASCNSLLGPRLWRRWDKPYLAAITAEAHRLGLLVHCHIHGKIMDTVPDLAQIGFDCVCPFERDPGDVNGLEGLLTVRRLLDGRVTFNGNVNTVATLINGGPDDVRREVRQIKQAFAGSPRLIIGTGDQVGGETPEENIHAMIEEGRKRE